MKALVAKTFGPHPQFAIEEREVPALKEGHTLVKMYAATVNPLSNTIRMGGLPLATAPRVLSNDGAGIVARSGKFAVGAKVAIYGGGQLGITQDGLQQQWVLVDDKRLIEMPADYRLDYAAALPINYVTAYQAMTRVGEVQPGQTVAITGATGSVGHALIQTAQALGAIPVAIVSSAAKAAHARHAGARHVIDLSSQDVQQAMLAITNGVGADVAFDPVGGDVLGLLIRSVRSRGTVVSIGFVAGSEGKIDLPDLVIQEKKLLGYDAWMETDEDVETALQAIRSHSVSGVFKPRIDGIYAMQDFAAAYDRLTSRAATGTVLLRLNED